ncbi:ATP synthase I chain [Paraliobacillus sp. PM-2]|uniref:ATP synthase subunit I n=1 Tax=Paraliobacillus sp. PM-2 TaxID=1462524 RepID=UPI00061C6741|nr:ATP synthase subunit I [Paraliobacillus sp. PM-2]CQR46162.1 ATP synthase I chain [Paraliobacillus sp. PM-2]
MSDKSFQRMINRQKKWMLYYLALLTLAALFTSYHSFFTGLLLGTALSYYNLWLLQRKIQKFTYAIQNNQKMFGLGTFSRFASAGLAVLIGYELEAYFDMTGILIGLATMFVVIIIDFAIYAKQEDDRWKRGERNGA